MTFSQSWAKWCTVGHPWTPRPHDPCHSQAQEPRALSFDFHTDHTSATPHSPLDFNLFLSLWLYVLRKRHVRVQTHDTIHLCLATQSQAALMGFNQRGQGQEQGLQCMMPLIYHGKQSRLWCPCDPGVWGSHGSVGFSPLWTHLSCHECERKRSQIWTAGKNAFQSNSIGLSLLPLPSLSSPGTAWDVSALVLTCGEKCHVKFLW